MLVWVLKLVRVMMWHLPGIRVYQGQPWLVSPPAAWSLLRPDCSEHMLQKAFPAHTSTGDKSDVPAARVISVTQH